MARYGYQSLSLTNFVGFHHELTRGAWGAIDTGSARSHLTLEDATGVYFKRTLHDAIDGMVAAQHADNDVQSADAPWDDAERRLVLTVQIKTLDADASVRADALRAQALLCPDGSTAMTRLDAQEEVDFARNQLQLAREPSLAAIVERLGLRALLDDVARCTDALDLAVRGGGAEASSRSQRIKRAHRRCVTAFNHVHEGLTMLADQETRPKEKQKLAALLDPFTRLLARRPEDTADATDDSADSTTGAQPAPAQPVARVG